MHHFRSPKSNRVYKESVQLATYGRIVGTKGSFGEDFDQLIPSLNDTRKSHSPNYKLAKPSTYYPVSLQQVFQST